MSGDEAPPEPESGGSAGAGCPQRGAALGRHAFDEGRIVRTGSLRAVAVTVAEKGSREPY
ncbi:MULTISPECIES: hypothetical protein [Streptomyces]|uniref:Uncharacterized protein n=1 Tax=Streptomyces tsukubensis (strain DSM 42081 / NBRC 108919 / NRRL 18488 / 9993) TaxID=1114943 RepID=A0A7G3UGH7_STRT9|nr:MULTISPECIES: hypothetical protein [Streptomyces]AZK94425.1 hypothetical protein B7R87_11570 [Streptomyces tsukubensis]MYS63444.1 hypothetical protein [Streptomyces sp. SID5473]QKM69484.1 hypothetical protein STSU_022205 [Streptomyces tsukubensis NRRL18488]TAI42586.1 hypothetical protein EWI31_19325 [Streptomyces tsukubensis]